MAGDTSGVLKACEEYSQKITAMGDFPNHKMAAIKGL